MRSAAVCVFVWFISFAASAFAQSGRQLVVIVLDPTEQTVPGATVTVEQNGATRQTLVTDANGQAATTSLAAGAYQIKATLEGFTDALPMTARVASNQPTRVTVRLGLPRVADTVTVAGGIDVPAAETAVQHDSITPDGSADDQILQNTIDALAGIGSVVRVDGLRRAACRQRRRFSRSASGRTLSTPSITRPRRRLSKSSRTRNRNRGK